MARRVELHRRLAIHLGDVEARVIEAEVADRAGRIARARISGRAKRVARLCEEGAAAAENVLAVAAPENVGHGGRSRVAEVDDAAAGGVPLLAAGDGEVGLVLVGEILRMLRDGIELALCRHVRIGLRLIVDIRADDRSGARARTSGRCG